VPPFGVDPVDWLPGRKLSQHQLGLSLYDREVVNNSMMVVRQCVVARSWNGSLTRNGATSSTSWPGGQHELGAGLDDRPPPATRDDDGH